MRGWFLMFSGMFWKRFVCHQTHLFVDTFAFKSTQIQKSPNTVKSIHRPLRQSQQRRTDYLDL